MADANRPILPDEQAREDIRMRLDVSMLVEASAGTGKTTSMVDRMVEMIARGIDIETISAITFTRKAAAELRSRFLTALQQAARDTRNTTRTTTRNTTRTTDRQENFIAAMEKLDRCYIGTIHSFCGRLLREYPMQAGVSVNFTEIEDSDDIRLREEAWHIFTAAALADDAAVLPQSLADMGLDFNSLLSPFRDAFCNYPDVMQWPVDDVGFPDINDLKSHLSALGEYVDYMASLADDLQAGGTDKLVSDVFLRLPGSMHSIDLGDPVEVLRLFCEFKKSYKKTNKNWPGKKTQAEDEHERWCDFYDRHIAPPVAQAMAARYSLAIEVFAAAGKVYDDLRRRRSVLNFQDLLLKARDLLRDSGDIRRQFQQDIRYLLVDEFQDTDPVQAEIMLLLAADDERCNDWRLCRPRPGSLFVVGDPKQSIYRFRRADIQTYNFVRDCIADSGGEVLKLVANFRSCPSVIGWVNEIFGDMFAVDSRQYQAEPEDMSVGREFGDLRGDLDGVVSWCEGLKGRSSDVVIAADAARIAALICDALANGKTITDFDDNAELLRRPLGAGDFLVLTPSARQLGDYASVLQAAGLPVAVTGGGELNGRREALLLLKILKAVAEPGNTVALLAWLRSEAEGFSDAELLAIKRAGGSFKAGMEIPDSMRATDTGKKYEQAFERLRQYGELLNGSLPAAVAVERILDISGLMLKWAVDGESRSAAPAIWRLIELAGQRCGDGGVGQLCELLDEIVSGSVKYDLPAAGLGSGDCVRLMNLHKAKGLEAPVVILAYPRGRTKHPATLHVLRDKKIEGYMSISASAGPNANMNILLAQPTQWPQFQDEEEKFLAAEEARLLYVAATRAGRMLLVSSNEGNYSTSDPWHALSSRIDENAVLPLLEAPALALTETTESCDAAAVQSAVESLDKRKAALLEKSYCVQSARQLALADAPPLKLPKSSDQDGSASDIENLGPQWGSAVHALLESLSTGPCNDLHAAAQELCSVYELDADMATNLAQTAVSVTASELWQRAKASPKRLSEVPFELLAGDSGPAGEKRIISGVIDLAFRCDGGWAIVDYKTDAAAADLSARAALAEHYSPQLRAYSQYWLELTGEPVVELGIFFTATGDYVRL